MPAMGSIWVEVNIMSGQADVKGLIPDVVSVWADVEGLIPDVVSVQVDAKGISIC